jgi:hypothetical protein
MTKSVRVVLSILVLAGLLGVILQQQLGLSRLRDEREVLQAQAAEQAALREEAERQAKAQADSPELQRLRADRDELLRLRNEVTQLRRQLAEATARRAASLKANSTTSVEQASAPVQTFTATVGATIGWRSTLVMGGWPTQPGKRSVFLVQPELAGEAKQSGSILVKTRILEMPDEVFAQMGLDGLRTEGRLSSSHVVLTPEQTEAIVKALETTAGVDVLSAPRVLTSNGVAARVSIGDTKTSPSGESYQTGPSLEVLPTVSADPANVRLDVSAQLRLPNRPSQ